MTISEVYAEFLSKYIELRLKPNTRRGYKINMEKHVLKYIKYTDVKDVTVDTLDELTSVLSSRGLSYKSIVYVHATLRKMLNFSIKRGYITSNPYDAFDMPRPEEYIYTVLDDDSYFKMLQACRGDELQIPITLALRYGLRRGEVLGVNPVTDLNLSTNTLHIQRTRNTEYGKDIVTSCKTKSGNRYILLLPEDSHLLSTIVSPYACSLSSTMLDKKFKSFLRDNGFPPMRFHDLRHTYATYMLSKGVNPKIVSSVLGHSGVDITLDLYSHPDVRMQSACLEVL